MLTATGMRCLALLLILLVPSHAPASDNYETAPREFQAAFFFKVLAYYRHIPHTQDPISLYVLGDPDFAALMETYVGRVIEDRLFASVLAGGDLPDAAPSLLYIGKKDDFQKAVSYARQNKVLTFTGYPDLVPLGITLGVGLKQDRPTILLNLGAAKRENVHWDLDIVKAAKVYHAARDVSEEDAS